MEEGLSAGVCARSDGRLLSEAQPATCNATKQVHTGLQNEKKEKKKGEEERVCVCVWKPPSPEKKVKPSSSLAWPMWARRTGLGLGGGKVGGSVFTRLCGFLRCLSLSSKTCSLSRSTKMSLPCTKAHAGLTTNITESNTRLLPF